MLVYTLAKNYINKRLTWKLILFLSIVKKHLNPLVSDLKQDAQPPCLNNIAELGIHAVVGMNVNGEPGLFNFSILLVEAPVL